MAAGDSVLARGVTAVINGSPVINTTSVSLDSVSWYFRYAGCYDRPGRFGTSRCTRCTAGFSLGAQVTDTMTVSGEYLLTLNDGSGDLTAVIDPELTAPIANYVPGVEMDLVGLLVPRGSGAWR